MTEPKDPKDQLGEESTPEDETDSAQHTEDELDPDTELPPDDLPIITLDPPD